MGGDVAAALVRGAAVVLATFSTFLLISCAQLIPDIHTNFRARCNRRRYLSAVASLARCKVVGSIHDEMRERRRWQFSIKSALAACTCVAVLSAIIARIPLDTWIASPAFVTTATIIAIITLLAAWIVFGKGTLKQRSAAAIAVLTVLFGCMAISATNSDAQLPLAPFVLDAYFSISKYQIALFFSIAIGLFAAMLLSLRLSSAAFPDGLQPAPTRKRRVWLKRVLICWSVLIVAPPAIMLIALLQPLPQVDNTLPTPNGYNELVRIGKQFQGSAIMKELAADVVDEVKLDAAVPKYQVHFAAIRKVASTSLLVFPFSMTSSLTSTPMPVEICGNWRTS